MLRSLAGRQEALEPGLVTALLQITLHGTSLSGQTAQQVAGLLDRRTRDGLTGLAEFKALPETARRRVLEHNLPLVHRFRQAVCLATPALSWHRLVGIFVGEQQLLACEGDLPRDLSAKAAPSRPFQYRDLLSSASCHARPELEAAHTGLVKELAGSLDLEDEVQLVLTALIIAFCPDFLDLGEPRMAVERTQLKFVLLLQSHLAGGDPAQAGARLARTLMVPAIARQIHQLARERLVI
jgi:hypothetical protein